MLSPRSVPGFSGKWDWDMGSQDQAGVTASPREVREVSAEEHDPACAHLTFIRVATRADVRQLLDSAR
jgi:hypothetical protein